MKELIEHLTPHQIIFSKACGDYQGDEFIIFARRKGDYQDSLDVCLIVYGYGSCSGCDEIERAKSDGDMPELLDILSKHLRGAHVIASDPSSKQDWVARLDGLINDRAGYDYWATDETVKALRDEAVAALAAWSLVGANFAPFPALDWQEDSFPLALEA